MSTIGTLVVGITADIAGLTDGLDKAQSKVSSSGKKLIAIGAGMTGAVLAPIAAVGAGAVKVSMDTQTAAANMASSLGLPIDKAEEFAEVARQVYGNNFTDSVTTAADAVADVAKQFDLAANNPALQRITEQALSLEDSFGVGVTDSVSTAKQLMKDFGISSEEAFDFITAGYQRGLNSSGDFLDSVSEYSTQFSNGGASAGQFFSLLESGQQAGMAGTDKAADAFKEFRLRIVDGSDATAEGLAAIGLSADDMASAIADGTMTAADAFAIVTDKLAETDDSAVRMQAGAALLGTQFEDLGDSAVAGLDLAGTSMSDLEGSTDSLNAKYETFGDKAKAMWREVTVAAAPLVDELLRVAEEAMPAVEEAITALIPLIEDLATGISPIIERASEWVTNFANMDAGTRKMILKGLLLVAALGPLVGMLGSVMMVAASLAPILGGLGAALGLLLSPVGLVFAAVIGLAMVLFNVGGAGDWARKKLEAMGLDGLATALGNAQEKAAELVETVKGLVSGEISFGDLLPPDWISDLMFWNWPELGVPDWIEDLFSWAWPILGPVAWAVKLTNWAWPKLKEPGWISNLLDFEWPGMPDLPGWMGGGGDDVVGENAGGTSNWRGGLSWVGEEGPELVNLPRGSQVFPADVSAQMAGAGGEVTINQYNTINSEIDEYLLARRVVEIIRKG